MRLLIPLPTNNMAPILNTFINYEAVGGGTTGRYDEVSWEA
jgi:hypothetical protein